jgi:hypothetical protein
MYKKLRQVLLIALVAFVASFMVAKPVLAADSVSVGGFDLTKGSIVNAINAPTPNLANTTAYVFYTLSVIINGTFDGYLANCPNADCPATSANPEVNNINGGRQLATRPDDVSQAVSRGGLGGGIAYLMGQLIGNPPASAQTYVADLVQNSRFAPPTYAQGVGFGALNPILGTWKAFRDIAYYLLTVMFFITGFLILIRSKISGNVAVTVQNALPRLVLTLIMITFSYAIAGLVVDAMFISLYFLVNLFNQYIFNGNEFFRTLGNDAPVTPRTLAFDTHIFSFFFRYVFSGTSNASAWKAAQALGNLVSDTIGGVFGDVLGKGGSLGGLFNGILQVVFTIIFGIALLISMFRVFFELLMSYAGFVINVVLAPVLLLQNALPGKGNFMDWIKNLIGGLAPFVVAVFMIFMSLALTGSETKAGIGYQMGMAGDQTGLRLPLILTQEVNPQAFVGILGMGFMLLLPEVVKITKKLVGAKEGPFDQFKDAALKNFKQGWEGGKPLGVGPSIPGGQRLLFGDKKSRELAAKQGGGTLGQRYGIMGAGAKKLQEAAVIPQNAFVRGLKYGWRNAFINIPPAEPKATPDKPPQATPTPASNQTVNTTSATGGFDVKK